MAKIKPFKGIRYNQSKVKLTNVVAPPYDVISSKEQAALYKKNNSNVIRLILGKEKKTDTTKINKYSRANEFLNSWLDKGILQQEEKESIYVYKQDFLSGKKKVSRIGFISLLRLEPLFKGTVYPHERTLSKPKADRLNLMKKCNTNFSQIFALYNDRPGSIDKILNNVIKRKPSVDILDHNKERNRLWIIDEPKILNLIKSKMENKKVFIADGHHRYETALNYANIMKKKKNKGNTGYIMTFFCNMSNKGLVVFPTHRLVKLAKKIDLVKLLEKYFVIQDVKSQDMLLKSLDKEYKTGSIAFGMFENKKYKLLKLKSKNLIKDKIKYSSTYKELDVYILENIVFEQALKFSKKDIALQKYIKYVKHLKDSIDLVKTKQYDVAFIMNPTRLKQIERVALAGEVMPQKSTYFYPKLLSGLAINKLFPKK